MGTKVADRAANSAHAPKVAERAIRSAMPSPDRLDRDPAPARNPDPANPGRPPKNRLAEALAAASMREAYEKRLAELALALDCAELASYHGP